MPRTSSTWRARSTSGTRSISGHSTGGGEVARYVARAEEGRVSKAILISAITPHMLKTDANPGGLPIEVFDGFRAAMANRAQFYIDVPAGPFYNFNKPGVETIQGLVDNWWRQGIMGSALGQYECIEVFSNTDQTEDLKAIDVPVLVIHSEDDQIVPYADSAPLAVKLLRNGTLKTYQGLPHGCMTTHPDLINADILGFIQQGADTPSQAANAEPALV
jgi:non-heme chloroperoxidase